MSLMFFGSISSSMKGSAPVPVIGTATDVGTARAYNNGAADVTFTAGAGAPTTSFTVTSSPGGFTNTGAASPIRVSGLQSGVSYTFTVTGTNASGTSVASSASNAITATTVPGAPTIGTATCAAGQTYASGGAAVSVPFTAGNTGGKAITSFTVTSSSTATSAGGASPLAFASETVGVARTYTVTATNANGTGAASSASNSLTPSTKPATPTIGTASRTSNTIASVAFSGQNGGSAITSVQVITSIGVTTGGSTSPVTATGTYVYGVNYLFSVIVTNAQGSSPQSLDSNAVAMYEYSLGDTGPGGGKVWYDAGSVQSWGRYIEVAPSGWNGGSDPIVDWSATTGSFTSGTNTAYGYSKANTDAMIAQDATAGYAGTLSRAYTGGGKTDWSLPSFDELSTLYNDTNNNGGWAGGFYWSSSEDASVSAWTNSGNQNKTNSYSVRPVRYF